VCPREGLQRLDASQANGAGNMLFRLCTQCPAAAAGLPNHLNVSLWSAAACACLTSLPTLHWPAGLTLLCCLLLAAAAAAALFGPPQPPSCPSCCPALRRCPTRWLTLSAAQWLHAQSRSSTASPTRARQVRGEWRWLLRVGVGCVYVFVCVCVRGGGGKAATYQI
jgi:hypothetical protein